VNKFMLFGVLTFILIMITFVVEAYAIVDLDVIQGITSADSIVNGTPTVYNSTTIWTFLDTFLNMLFFNIDGNVLPDIFVLGVVWPIVGILFFMVIDVVKDLIPFT